MWVYHLSFVWIEINNNFYLNLIKVQRSGLARRGGIRVNDIITQINDTPADVLTLRDAQLLIRESGKFVRIYVKGDSDIETEDELTVDFWFTPRKYNKIMFFKNIFPKTL